MAKKGSVKDRVLNAASEEFLSNGFSAATTRAIARRAGTSESSLFRYFETKFDLLSAVLQRGWSQLTTSIDEQLQTATDPADALLTLGKGMLTFYLHNPEIGILLLSESWVQGPSSIAHSKSVASAFLSQETCSFVNRVDSMISDGQGRGLIASDLKLEAIREAYFGMVEGIAYGWYLSKHTEYRAHFEIQQAIPILRRFIQGLKGDDT